MNPGVSVIELFATKVTFAPLATVTVPWVAIFPVVAVPTVCVPVNVCGDTVISSPQACAKQTRKPRVSSVDFIAGYFREKRIGLINGKRCSVYFR